MVSLPPHLVRNGQRADSCSVVVAPSTLSFKPGSYPNPKAASLEYITNLKQAWVDAAERCVVYQLKIQTQPAAGARRLGSISLRSTERMVRPKTCP